MVPSWGDRGLCRIWGWSLFWFHSRTLSVLDECNDLFMYLCDVASEDYLTCDIAFNAVMPLSRASTRRRYSCIEGVTFEEVLGYNTHKAFSVPRLTVGVSNKRSKKYFKKDDRCEQLTCSYCNALDAAISPTCRSTT